MNADADRTPRALPIVIAAALVAVLARLLQVLWLHPLNWDEIEFFRATDWVSRGLVPYRDFWEHHTPLQWFLFAPFAPLVRGWTGGWPIVALRVAQIPLWIAAFAAMAAWMREAGIPRFARWGAMAVALTSSFLMLAAIEYRIDVPGTALYAAGLLALQRMRGRPRVAILAGALFALAGLANIRLGPLLAVTAILACLADVREQRWRFQPRALWLAAGVAIVLALAGLYCLATHSAGDFVRRVWTENYLGDRYGMNAPGRVTYRLVATFGTRRTPAGSWQLDPAAVDLGGAVLILATLYGLARALTRWRRPDERFVLALLLLANMAFIAKMKTAYNYHFETVVLMALPFVALAIEDLKRPRAVAGLVAACALVATFASVFRGKEADRAYQDFIMREVERRTPPDAPVWDGVGWALHRKPAYRYWFIPDLVRQLSKRGLLEAYDVEQAAADPPAAVISDLNALQYLHDRPRLTSFLAAHYIRQWNELWTPGLTATLAPSRPRARWIVPVDGRYRFYAAPLLARHPWWQHGGKAELTLPPRPAAIGGTFALSVDGVPVLPENGVLALRRKQRVEIAGAVAEDVGVLLLPGDDTRLFRHPPAGVTLDALALRQTHVPSFTPFRPD